jgi:hypothetical protein
MVIVNLKKFVMFATKSYLPLGLIKIKMVSTTGQLEDHHVKNVGK